MDPSQTEIRFEFEDPIVEMIRIAMFSDTCQHPENVAFSYEDNGGYLDDICHGERYRRISEALPKGSAILGSILSTDGICLDKCLFDSQEVGALACTFIRGSARDRDECMAPLCTFGKLKFAGMNNRRKAAQRFKKYLDHVSLNAILSRYRSFNRNGGALVPMHGGVVHFRYACVVALYADIPAARKLLMTGSACNTCYLPCSRMGTPGACAAMRTWRNTTEKREAFLRRIEQKDGETAEDVRREANVIGVELDTANAFETPEGDMNIIGPCDDVDNPFAACPPVFLHGMECGTLMKLVSATLNHLISAAATAGQSSPSLCREIDAFCSAVCTLNKRCSNVELGAHPLVPMPYGITAHVINGKTLDGNKRLTLARLMHMFVASSTLFSPAVKKKHCALYTLVFRCREMMLSPTRRDQLEDAQTLLDEMDEGLIKYSVEYSASNCCSEKHHQWRHYSFHRSQIGATALEMSFEHAYAVGFKKLIGFTNKSTVSKSEQTAKKFWQRRGLWRLAGALGLRPLAHETPTCSPKIVELTKLSPVSDHVWPDARSARVLRAAIAAMDPPITCASTSVRLALVNRQLPSCYGDKRLVLRTLRSEFTGKQRWVDDVRIKYDNNGATCYGFAKCLGFFMDAAECVHIAVQWYDVKSRNMVDAAAGMTKVELSDTFDLVPAGSIRNGCLLAPLAKPPAVGCPQQFWVLQSQRELGELRAAAARQR